jgi:hypothetical protein
MWKAAIAVYLAIFSEDNNEKPPVRVAGAWLRFELDTCLMRSWNTNHSTETFGRVLGQLVYKSYIGVSIT